MGSMRPLSEPVSLAGPGPSDVARSAALDKVRIDPIQSALTQAVPSSPGGERGSQQPRRPVASPVCSRRRVPARGGRGE